MKALFTTSVLALALSAAASLSQAMEVRASKSSDLRVALVDTCRQTAEQQAMHHAFAAGLAAEMSVKLGDSVGVRLVTVEMKQLLSELAEGKYEAALVISSVPPVGILKEEFTVLRAQSDYGAPPARFHLILRNSDPSLKDMMGASFAQVIEMPRVKEALYRASAIKVVASIPKDAEKSSVAASSSR